MKKSHLSRFVGYYKSYYSEHVHSLGFVNTIFLGLCSINHLCVQTHQICTPILTVQHSHHTDYHNLIFSRYDKFSTLFHLLYLYAHINKVKYGFTGPDYSHQHLKRLDMFFLCCSWGNSINNKTAYAQQSWNDLHIQKVVLKFKDSV